MARHGLNKYQYPVRHSNQFTLLAEGDVYFSAMLRAIENARRYILLEQYLISSGTITHSFIQSLTQAAHRGVEVYLLLDDFGASELNEQDRSQLQQAGIHFYCFNPVRYKRFFKSLFRNHRKILIVDNEVVFVGGAGLSDEFSKSHYGELAWHDVMLEIKGEVIDDWFALFEKTWRKHAGQDFSVDRLSASPAGSQTGRILSSNPLRKQDIYRALIKHMRRARQRIWITSPYFVTTRKLRRLLRQATHRGVDVRLLLPGQFSDHPWVSFAARRHYTRLLRHGVRIFEYQPRFTHAKIQLCDDWVSIGSSNLDRWNQRWNLDANQAIYDAGFAKQTAQLFEQNFSHSHEVSYAAWQRRPWLTRLRERLSGQLVNWLEKIFRRLGNK